MRLSALRVAVTFLAAAGVIQAADLNEMYENLKQAVAATDGAQVLKIVREMNPLLCEATAGPQGEADSEEKASSTRRKEWADGVATYTEYALFATALASAPKMQLELFAELEQQNPKSKYLDEAYGPYLVALNKSGAAARIPAVAEKGLTNFPENEDLLLVLADQALSRRQNERAVAYANRLVAALSKHPRPQQISPAEWERKRNAAMGRGYWIAGVVSGEQSQYASADRNLRAALPLIQGNEAMLGPALFYLGVANYNIGKMTANKGRMLEGASFSDRSSKIQSPLQDQAWRNAALIQKEAAAMR